MKGFNSLRTLARTHRWQVTYSRCKELNHVQLFENEMDFTPIQLAFMQWLELYHNLECDLAMKKPYLSREIIEDDIRCDAYLVIRDSEDIKPDSLTKSDKDTPAQGNDDVPSIVFN